MNADAIKYACETNFDVVPSRSTRDELVIICPEEGCGDKSGNRSISLKTGKTTCWRCGALKGHSGSFARWARRFGVEVGADDEVSLAGRDLEDLSLTAALQGERQDSGYVSEVKLPRGFTALRDDPDGAYARLIGRMARAKHLHLNDFIKAGVGYTTESPAWEPYAIFPVVEWGRTVYYQGRLYGEAESWMKGTKKFPHKNVVPVGASHWVYNIDQARATRATKVVIVESILNVLSFEKELAKQGVTGVTTVAVFKHAVSEAQRVKLLALRGLEEIVILFDDDAMASAWETALDLSGRVRTTVCSMPEKVDANDDSAAAYRAYLARKQVSSSSMLLAKLNYGV